MVSLDLEGIADGGVLSVAVYCRILEEEEEADNNNNRSCLKNGKLASRFVFFLSISLYLASNLLQMQARSRARTSASPAFQTSKGLRIRPPQTVHVRRVHSARPQPASSITIEDSITKQCEDDEGEGERSAGSLLELGFGFGFGWIDKGSRDGAEHSSTGVEEEQ